MLVLVSFAVTAALAEWLLGVYAPDIPVWRTISRPVAYQHPSVYSPYLPFTLPRASTMVHVWGPQPKRVRYVFNEYGFRGPAVPPPPAGPSGRIVVFGDSFAFGWLMEEPDTFPARLQARLSEEGRGCAVINAGYHSGYSPDAYYASLLHEAAYFAPSIVVVALYLGNDLTDVAENQWHALDAYGLPRRVTTGRAFIDPDGHYIATGAPVYRVPLLRESRLAVGIARLLDRHDGKRQADPSSAFNAALGGLHRLAGELGADDLFVLIPPIEHDKERTRFTYALHDPVTGTTRDYLQQTVGAPVLDLRETFAAEPSVEALALPLDGHFTAETNRKVAAAIQQALAAGGVLDRRCPSTPPSPRAP